MDQELRLDIDQIAINTNLLHLPKRFTFKSLIKYLGPAFIVSVAYIDPGNFATNISGGSMFNYSLLWVILGSNLMAIFLQISSAKLGIATGLNLPNACKLTFSKKTNWILWIVAEFSAIATTLAEFLGAALGLYLLFGILLPIAGIITAIITFFITYLQKYGQRTVEVVITILVAIICFAYGFELFLAKPDWQAVSLHTLMPSIPNQTALLIAVGMLGATVMPHVIYLHSDLVQWRNNDSTLHDQLSHLRFEKIDIVIAMNIAFIVNAAMVIVSAAVFYKSGIVVDTIEQAHISLKPLLGPLSSGAFALALIASGFSSSAVGTMAGETVMDGFIDLKLSPFIKRIITITPAMIIILIGINPLKALVLSQVSLSFALPFAIIPLLLLTSNKKLMNEFTNTRTIKIIGTLITTIILLLNVTLIVLTFL